MKRVLFMIATLAAVLTAGAQRRIEMNRDFDVSGEAFIFSKSEKLKRSDYMPVKWNLKNTHVGDVNFLTFSAENAKTGESLALKAWSEGIGIQLRIQDGKKTYVVYDNDFFHLMIMEIDGGTAILYYPQLRKKP